MAATDDDSFYLTLPSNVNEKDYAENKAGHFITTITPPLVIPHDAWDVGLAEVAYTRPHLKLRKKGRVNFRMVDYTTARRAGEAVFTNDYHHIKPGKYKDMVELTDTIERVLVGTPMEKGLRLDYDADTRRTTLSFFPRLVGNKEKIPLIRFDAVLGEALGFDPDVLLRAGVHEGKVLEDNDAGLGNFYLYSNVVTDQHVGNAKVPLLRMVTVSEEDRGEKVIAKTFRRIHYAPARSVKAEPVEIMICRDDGTVVNFPNCDSLVKLHFKRKKRRT